jgi:hypothetical protein
MNNLRIRKTPGSEISETAPGDWKLSLPAGKAGAYRWAQLDDYLHLSRSAFLWRSPLTLEVSGRVSTAHIPGTWGFGFWNDPFNASAGIGGTGRRLPALPNCAWFFYASSDNYLALHDSHPAQGFLAATFSSPLIPPFFLAAGLPVLPLLTLAPAARIFRRFLRSFVKESAALLDVDVTALHSYQLEWDAGEVRFLVDGETRFKTPVSPLGRLGLVMWIDNQFAAFPPDGKVRFGSLDNPEPVWLELSGISVHE